MSLGQFFYAGRTESESESEKLNKIPGPCQRAKKTVEHASDIIQVFGIVPQNQEKRLEELEITGKIETTQSTELLKSA